MKRAQTTPTKPRLPKMGFHKASGKYRVYLSGIEVFLGADPAEAQKRYRLEVAAWMGRSCQAPPPAPDEIRVMELVSRYTAYAREYYAACPDNVDRLKVWLQPLIDLCDTLPAAALSPQLLKAVRSTMAEGRPADPVTKTKARRAWTRKYCNQAVQGIVRMYKWAASEGLIPVAAWQALTTVEGLRKGFCTAKESGVRHPITQEELDAVRGSLPSPVMAALEVMFLCGARPSEVLNLKPADIDRAGDVWRAELVKHKTANKGKTRTLHFGPKAQRVLQPYLLRPADAYLFNPAESAKEMIDRHHAARKTHPSTGNNLGTNRVAKPEVVPGDHYVHTAFRRCVARAIDRINRDRAEKNVERKAAGETEAPMLRQFCPYEARHAGLTNARKNAGPETAQAVGDHARLDMTEHYAGVSSDLAVAYMAKHG